MVAPLTCGVINDEETAAQRLRHVARSLMAYQIERTSFTVPYSLGGSFEKERIDLLRKKLVLGVE